ncbi:MAG: SDR family oxidoreductase [Nannocystaceae bacterium]|nr:SDR family oxidoreductase [Nannocystaceae bacterium]
MGERHVLITGGGGGLGLHVTHAFLSSGARLTVPVRDDADRERLREALGEDIGRVKMPQADLTDEASVETLLAGDSPPDALVHLVGGFAMGPLDEATLATYEQQMDLNVRTTFLLLKHGIAAMRTVGHGRIVTVASKAALEPMAGMGLYGAAKAAVLALTQAAACETKGTGITANTVLPSIIDTPANRAAMGDADAHTWVQPERLAATILFLCSDAGGDLRGSAVRTYGSA